ncbi:hypothetical protein [Rummeliibacillus pycnus]|uniref:hypothetical protein n=1 Tax=Rummeliibacillus pycnus TaxID=101070 RepID=UPI003D28E9D5
MAIKRKIKIITAIVLLIVIATPIYFHYKKIEKYEDTLDYLMNDREYYESDMESITVKHTLSGIWLPYKNEWTVQVVFNDEPKAKYFYNVIDGRVIQISWSGSTENNIYMHSESVECGPFGN